MIFHIEREQRGETDTFPPRPRYVYFWTLCRQLNGGPGEAICKSVDVYATEKACRSAINTVKKSMAGVRFAKTQVKSYDA